VFGSSISRMGLLDAGGDNAEHGSSVDDPSAALAKSEIPFPEAPSVGIQLLDFSVRTGTLYSTMMATILTPVPT